MSSVKQLIEILTFKKMWVIETTYPGLPNLWFGSWYDYKNPLWLRWLPLKRNGFFPGYIDPRFFILTPQWHRMSSGFKRASYLQAKYICWYIRHTRRVPKKISLSGVLTNLCSGMKKIYTLYE